MTSHAAFLLPARHCVHAPEFPRPSECRTGRSMEPACFLFRSVHRRILNHVAPLTGRNVWLLHIERTEPIVHSSTGDARADSNLLWHTNISTTQRYMHPDDSELADAQDLID
jgi:hypothetical protein